MRNGLVSERRGQGRQLVERIRRSGAQATTAWMARASVIAVTLPYSSFDSSSRLAATGVERSERTCSSCGLPARCGRDGRARPRPCRSALIRCGTEQGLTRPTVTSEFSKIRRARPVLARGGLEGCQRLGADLPREHLAGQALSTAAGVDASARALRRVR